MPILATHPLFSCLQSLAEDVMRRVCHHAVSRPGQTHCHAQQGICHISSKISCLLFVGFSLLITLPSTNMAPLGGYLEDWFPLQGTSCLVLC